jgi:pSer/pThr/pTyr-binding forkhead associated (FHA) protein
MPALLKTYEGQTKIVPLSEGVTLIGRAEECHVRIPHPVVSKVHAIVEFDGHCCTVENKGRNGTVLKGERLDGISRLQDRDEFRIGGAVFLFLQELPDAGSESDSDALSILREVARIDAADESIRRHLVPPTSPDVGRENETLLVLREDKIRLRVPIKEQSLSSLAAADPMKLVSQMLRLAEFLRESRCGHNMSGVLDCLMTMFPQATQIAIVEQESAVSPSVRVMATFSRNSELIPVICSDVLQRAMDLGECLLLADMWRDSPGEKPMLSRMGRVSLLCVPVLSDCRTSCGAVQLIATDDNPEFEKADLERLAILAQLLRIVVGIPTTP